MPITDSQAIQSILTPRNQKALKRASDDNDRQRFHTGPATSEEDAGPYAAVLKARVEKILNNKEKFDKFCALLNYPLPSSRIIDKGADEYQKAFGAEDKYVDFEFSSDNLKADAAEFLDRTKFDDWLTKNLFNQCLRASAAVWIVDLPAEVNAEGFAEPVLLLREVGKLHDLFTDRRGDITAVIYPMAPLKDESGKIVAKRWAVIDDESYRVAITRDGETQPAIQFTNYHDLQRCPAGWVWHDRLDENQPIRIQSPLHAIFSELDDLVVGTVFKQHADLYASWPIFRSYKTRCNYEVPGTGEQCNNGYVTIRSKEPDEEGNYTYKLGRCPVCEKKKPIGPGSHIETPAPVDNMSADLSNPASFINPERELLDYNTEKLEDIEARVTEYLTGDVNNVDQGKEAVNADQVAARQEVRKSIVGFWAGQIQRTHYEVLYVLFALRYGPSFLSLAVDYGTEFHLLSPGQAITDYDAARKANLPMYQLALRRQRIDKLLAGSNEAMATRLELLSMLEPYPDQPLMVVPAGSDAWELKANFSQYIARFEAENIGLETFGKALSLPARIQSITEVLYQYVQDGKARREVPEVPSPDGGKGNFGR
ncbi:hypothetical protein GCM10028818_41090 [Spirosoma horti]